MQKLRELDSDVQKTTTVTDVRTLHTRIADTLARLDEIGRTERAHVDSDAAMSRALASLRDALYFAKSIGDAGKSTQSSVLHAEIGVLRDAVGVLDCCVCCLISKCRLCPRFVFK
jgi:hypothetical protein